MRATLEPSGRTRMDVTLTPELEQFVQERVASGKNDSASDVLLESLRLLQEREREEAEKLAWLRAAIDAGIASAERGELLSGEEVFARLRARIGGRNES
jgi:antitoxin ParD1/3/4